MSAHDDPFFNPIWRAGERLLYRAAFLVPEIDTRSQEERIAAAEAGCDDQYRRFRRLIRDAVLKDAGQLGFAVVLMIRPEIPPPLDCDGNPLPPLGCVKG